MHIQMVDDNGNLVATIQKIHLGIRGKAGKFTQDKARSMIWIETKR
jgi:hypothetical protein